MRLLLAEGAETFWMPPQSSTFASDVDFVFYFIYWVSAVFFVVIAGLMFLFIFRHRAKDPGAAAPATVTHNNTLEIAWTVLPALLLVPMFWWGFTGFMDMRTPPADTFDINVAAQKWNWAFTYPNGIEHEELHVWVGRPTKLIMNSSDVLHSLYIPAFRVKRDVVPGRYSFLWFEATQAGTYDLFCTEYCGTSHSDMNARVIVHESEAEYRDWLEFADPINGLPKELWPDYTADPEAFIALAKDPTAFVARYDGKFPDAPVTPEIAALAQKLETPVMMGDKLRGKKGCTQCHSIDGSAGNGPTWKGLYGSERQFTNGTSTVADENYLLTSIINPGNRIVVGYNNVMPKLTISDREAAMLIAYIKSLKSE